MLKVTLYTTFYSFVKLIINYTQVSWMKNGFDIDGEGVQVKEDGMLIMQQVTTTFLKQILQNDKYYKQ